VSRPGRVTNDSSTVCEEVFGLWLGRTTHSMGVIHVGTSACHPASSAADGVVTRCCLAGSFKYMLQRPTLRVPTSCSLCTTVHGERACQCVSSSRIVCTIVWACRRWIAFGRQPMSVPEAMAGSARDVATVAAVSRLGFGMVSCTLPCYACCTAVGTV
jgi:hypothetical protein